MQRIRITRHIVPDQHWLAYMNDHGEAKHIDFSGCANSFPHATRYASKDSLKAVGLRYEEALNQGGWKTVNRTEVLQ